MELTEVRVPERRVLIIESESATRELLSHAFLSNGYQVETADTGKRGLGAIATFRPHVVLLNPTLPDRTGTEVCRLIRGTGSGSEPAVILLTSKGEEIDRVVGFEVGADDCVVKPFSVRELLLRVRAVLRRRDILRGGIAPPKMVEDLSRNRKSRTLTAGQVRVDLDGHRVFVSDREIRVSALEMRLLTDLISNRGRVRSRQSLVDDVWGYKRTVLHRSVDAHIKSLRRALGGSGDLIETVRGVGYRVDAK